MQDTDFTRFPSRVLNGRMYNPAKAECLSELHPSNGGVFSFLFCKNNGELFIVECEAPGAKNGPHSFFFYTDQLLQRELRYFDASCIPEKSLKFHDIKE